MMSLYIPMLGYRGHPNRRVLQYRRREACAVDEAFPIDRVEIPPVDTICVQYGFKSDLLRSVCPRSITICSGPVPRTDTPTFGSPYRYTDRNNVIYIIHIYILYQIPAAIGTLQQHQKKTTRQVLQLQWSETHFPEKTKSLIRSRKLQNHSFCMEGVRSRTYIGGMGFFGISFFFPKPISQI